jgi:diacylglycerol O-acyltransferase / wax synthase
MPHRLSALDASLLYLEDATTPMHIGGVAIFRRPRTGFDYEQLLALVEQRLSLVPRYRQRVRYVPGHLARPVWTDDANFDITHHVRLSALPKPGTGQQLADLVARLMSRPLDHHRPLWEVYLVEGLQRNRFALVTKTHHAMIDGIGAIEIGQVILDVSPNHEDAEQQLWMPEPEPGAVGLLASAVSEVVRQPGELVENLRSAVSDVASTIDKVVGAASGVLSALSTAARPAPSGPLNVPITAERRFAVARATLADLKKVRAAHGGTVNNVVLAVVAGALRSWLMSRGEVVTSGTTVRAMAPLSVRDEVTTNTPAGLAGGKVSAYLVDLPVGEPSPVVRLQHDAHAMRARSDAGQPVAADALVRLSGFAPPTLHAMGARAASAFSRRIFNIL